MKHKNKSESHALRRLAGREFRSFLGERAGLEDHYNSLLRRAEEDSSLLDQVNACEQILSDQHN